VLPTAVLLVVCVLSCLLFVLLATTSVFLGNLGKTSHTALIPSLHGGIRCFFSILQNSQNRRIVMASIRITAVYAVFKFKIAESIYGVFSIFHGLKDGDLKPCCALVLVELSPERSKVFISDCLALLLDSFTRRHYCLYFQSTLANFELLSANSRTLSATDALLRFLSPDSETS
jgi:hypothetical protein